MAEQDNERVTERYGASDDERPERRYGGGGGDDRRGGPRGGRPGGGGRRGPGGPGGRRRGKTCYFCADKVTSIDYKNASLLRQYVATSGRIASRRKTGTCARHQRMLATAIKRARQIALLPYTSAHSRSTES